MCFVGADSYKVLTYSKIAYSADVYMFSLVSLGEMRAAQGTSQQLPSCRTRLPRVMQLQRQCWTAALY